MIKFKKIGVFGRMQSHDIRETVTSICAFLTKQSCDITLETQLASSLEDLPYHHADIKMMASSIDLALVIGGDGTLLSTARSLVDHDIPLLGINRGSLGFLTDVKPHEAEQKLAEILQGKYTIENRFLLEASVNHEQGYGLNEIVLSAQGAHHLIQYEIYVDKQFLCRQRADGLIVATPTGSTAYALSGGGPIIHPELNALTLLPMFPHTLSMRPIVVNGDSEIDVRIQNNRHTHIQLGCDTQTFIDIHQEDASIQIKKKAKKTILIHPLSYHYFKSLRSKLHWGSKLV